MKRRILSGEDDRPVATRTESEARVFFRANPGSTRWNQCGFRFCSGALRGDPWPRPDREASNKPAFRFVLSTWMVVFSICLFLRDEPDARLAFASGQTCLVC